jgi:D-glycero-D-manno-heptose 1,7-bisphosphate phosphatase
VLVLLDRDGVINEDRTDFVKSPDELVFIPNALKAIAALNAARHYVVIVTNQSCIGRGLITEETLTSIHNKLRTELRRQNGKIDQIFFAPDAPWEATENRKPGAGMIRSALRQFRTAPEQAVMIGDSLRDLQAAHKAGCHRILVQSGKGLKTQKDGFDPEMLPITVAKDLSEATRFILDGRFEP